MQYRVPQFIDMEDKVFWSLTIRQFIYLTGGVGAMVSLWLYTPRTLAFLIGIPILVAAFALAFYKVNNRYLSYLLDAALQYTIKPKLYLWQIPKAKKKKRQQLPQIPNSNSQTQEVKLTPGKLNELAWNLDIHENIHDLRVKQAQQMVEMGQ